MRFAKSHFRNVLDQVSAIAGSVAWSFGHEGCSIFYSVMLIKGLKWRSICISSEVKKSPLLYADTSILFNNDF